MGKKREPCDVTEIISENNAFLHRFFTDTTTLFEIMDVSGNYPLIKIRQSPGNRVKYEVNKDGVMELKTNDGEVVVKIRITGYVTNADVIDA